MFLKQTTSFALFVLIEVCSQRNPVQKAFHTTHSLHATGTKGVRQVPPGSGTLDLMTDRPK